MSMPMSVAQCQAASLLGYVVCTLVFITLRSFLSSVSQCTVGQIVLAVAIKIWAEKSWWPNIQIAEKIKPFGFCLLYVYLARFSRNPIILHSSYLLGIVCYGPLFVDFDSSCIVCRTKTESETRRNWQQTTADDWQVHAATWQPPRLLLLFITSKWTIFHFFGNV